MLGRVIEPLYLEYSARKLRQLFDRIRTCTGKLSDEQIWLRGAETGNAAGNLMLHLAGNLRQWIVSGVGGKPDVRVRDREFSARGGATGQELLDRLAAALEDAIAVIEALPPARLAERITVQQYNVSVFEAIAHVVEHFALHTGQVIFLTKALTGEDLGFYRHLNAPAHGEKTP